MVNGGITAVSFVTYSIPLLLLTGFLIIHIDIKAYGEKEMYKEQKVSRFLGWTNIVLGFAMFIVSIFLK
ncbi:CLC_0170 family protein [Paenibacillus solisilvae]|uniref:CLC_0170 family protein n=1 Tax=Paenibacillus solisilvae TaxID=2486751 RepID=A0ABW0W8X5_9BACL